MFILYPLNAGVFLSPFSPLLTDATGYMLHSVHAPRQQIITVICSLYFLVDLFLWCWYFHLMCKN